MKDSLVDLVESDNEDGVVESGVEGATASDESIEWLLMIICWYLFNFLFNNYVCIGISAY